MGEPIYTIGMKRNDKTYYMVDHTPHINHCLWSRYVEDAFGMVEDDAKETMDDLIQHGRDVFCTKHEAPELSFMGML